MKKRFIIGLDFGTSQSKVCVQHASENPKKHEFIQFKNLKGNKVYFLPSAVHWHHDNTFSYGFPKNTEVKKMYPNFKIAAAEDTDFRIRSNFNKDEEVYKSDLFKPFTPEVLSILYLTYLRFYIENYLSDNKSKSKELLGGFLSRFLSKPDEVDHDFILQLGIPTEYSSNTNYARKRKFETILLISSILMKKYGTNSAYLDAGIPELIDYIEVNNQDLQHEITDTSIHENRLNELKLSVFPENAAGLTFLVHTRQLNSGYYAALDIGAGSSDASFFRVSDDKQFHYLASDTVLIASNYLYSSFSGKSTLTHSEYIKVQKVIYELIQSGKISKNIKYIKSYTLFHKKLEKTLYRTFNRRVYYLFKKYKATQLYEDQPCLLLGGGSLLPQLKFDKYTIFDNGCPGSMNVKSIRLDKRNIGSFYPKSDVLPKDDTWKSKFVLLAVAYGLSFPHIDNQTNWDESYYKPSDDDLTGDPLIPHPFNENMYIYDVLRRKWGI